MEGLLPGFRVLDLADEKGAICSQILAMLGADVIKVERPGGDSSRWLGPFYHGIADPEKSLYWWAYNAGKRGITLDITHPKGQNLLLRLASSASVVIETFPPGYLDKLGLGYSALSELNPRIILTSITPFGQTGPNRDCKGSDLVAMAESGMMDLQGEPDREPLRLCQDQSHGFASTHAAVGTLLAYYWCNRTGQGQRVDVSLQDCLVRLNYRAPALWDLRKHYHSRTGNRTARERVTAQMVWKCSDGYVSWHMYGGLIGAKDNRVLTQWIKQEEGSAGELETVEWGKVDMSKVTLEQIKRWEAVIAAFFNKHTKSWVREGAWQRGLMLADVHNTRDVRESPQLSSRDFWAELEHSELGTSINYAGRLFLSSETECKLERRAPLIGEHNIEIYAELGLSIQEIEELQGQGII